MAAAKTELWIIFSSFELKIQDWSSPRKLRYLVDTHLYPTYEKKQIEILVSEPAGSSMYTPHPPQSYAEDLEIKV